MEIFRLITIILYVVETTIWYLFTRRRPDLWRDKLTGMYSSDDGLMFTHKAVFVLVHHFIDLILTMVHLGLSTYFAYIGPISLTNILLPVMAAILAGLNLGVVFTDIIYINDEDYKPTDLESLYNV